MKIDWKRKLTSRKFWVALAGFISPLLISFGLSENTVSQIVGIIMSGATCIAYILGEGMVDAGRESTTSANKNDNSNSNL